jgi:S-adenosylmethionine hydrolase
MPVITITSDLGTRDFYVAALKGAIISHCDFVPLIDVTHSIKPFNIKEAAFVVRNAYRYFPKGTIHVIHVNSGEGNGKLLLGMAEGHYFLTFDNGILSLLFEQTPHEIFQINDELFEHRTLLFETAIAKVIEMLLKEYRPTDFAHLTTDIVKFRLLQPVTSSGNIRGTVIYIDHFGNAVTNISRAMFTEFIGERSYTLLTNSVSTHSISQTYNDVEEGEMVCFFNSTNLLEVAINKGKAENLLGLKTDISSVLVVAD